MISMHAETTKLDTSQDTSRLIQRIRVLRELWEKYEKLSSQTLASANELYKYIHLWEIIEKKTTDSDDPRERKYCQQLLAEAEL
ncbi:MAG: hypothetical protein ACPKPY_11400 [Nitrososphaeraceae archaeon]